MEYRVVPVPGTGDEAPGIASRPVAGCRVDELIEAANGGHILAEDEVRRLVDALMRTAEAAAVAYGQADDRSWTVGDAVLTYTPEILRGAARHPHLLPEVVAVFVRVARGWPGEVLMGLNEQFRVGGPEPRAAALEVLDATRLQNLRHLRAVLAGFRDDPSPLGAAAHLLGALAAGHSEPVLESVVRLLRREPDLWHDLARAVGGRHATPELTDAVKDLWRDHTDLVRMFAREAWFQSV